MLLRVGGRRAVEEAAERLPSWFSNKMEEALDGARGLVERVDERFVERVQEEIQEVLEPSKRKRLSAYYTRRLGRQLMSELCAYYASGKRVVLADPFMGAGLTLTDAISRIGANSIKRVWGIEVEPLAALTGYAALAYFLRGDLRRVEVHCGDAFHVLSERKLLADVILTNPPFVRWELLDPEVRERVREFLSRRGYERYLRRRQLNLSVAGFLLADGALVDEGLIVSVLPSSTFYTITGEAVKNLLRERYSVLAIAETPENSFSTGSGFKENIIAALKDGGKRAETLFVKLSDEVDLKGISDAVMTGKAQAVGIVGARRLRELLPIEDMNWLTLFMDNEILSLLSKLSSTPMFIKGSKALGSLMVRGVEMFGPDFFFLPNRFWKVIETRDSEVVIRNSGTGQELALPHSFLVKALRRPGLYSRALMAEPQHYLLSIPPVALDELPRDASSYVRWGIVSGAAAPAARAFGERWYAHVHRQLRVKKPYGLLFLPDKVDWGLRHRSVFANLTTSPATASKNFYIVRLSDWRQACFLALWFNSAPFLTLLTAAGRRISARWTRLLEEDYMRLSAPALNMIGGEFLREAAELVSGLSGELPPIWEQLRNPPEWRLRLDRLMLEALRLEALSLEELYGALVSVLGINTK